MHIPERNEQVVGKVPDAVSISEEVKESEDSFEPAGLWVVTAFRLGTPYWTAIGQSTC